MPADQARRRPVIELRYVQDCPHYRGTLALVERVRGELGIDAELPTTLVVDQAAAEQARLPGRSQRAALPQTPSRGQLIWNLETVDVQKGTGQLRRLAPAAGYR
jgi:hypothetical protein